MERKIVHLGDKSRNMGAEVVTRFSGKFGVELPSFSSFEKRPKHSNEDTQSTSTLRPNTNESDREQKVASLIPPRATSNGMPVLFRADIDREDVAGQLYSFIYTLLYGIRAAEEIRLLTNSSPFASAHVKEILRLLNSKSKVVPENSKSA